MAKKKGTRAPNVTILVLVEGITEQIYFNQLRFHERQPGITILPKLAKYSSPYYIIKQALEAHKENIYDYIWCVFDADVLATQPKGFSDLYRKAEKAGILFAESFPCFEVWFLAHYVLPKKYYPNQNLVIQELQHHINDYCKELHWLRRNDIYSLLKINQDKAIERANTLLKQYEETHDAVVTRTAAHNLIGKLLV
jgi:hypothetical protein